MRRDKRQRRFFCPAKEKAPAPHQSQLDEGRDVLYDEGMDIFSQVIASARKLEEAAFVRQHPGFYLLRPKSPDELHSAAQGPNEDSGARRLLGHSGDDSGLRRLSSAQVLINEESLALPRPSVSPSGEIVLPNLSMGLYDCYLIEKTSRNVFSNGITIGRTQNNDIVVPLPAISKFHAWLKREAGSYIVYDAVNSHGTYVDNQRVSPTGEQGLFLRMGAQLRLGSVSLTFLDSPNLYRTLQREVIQKY